MSQEVRDLLKREGIFHQKSNPHTPQQNGVAERRNRYLVEMCRCLLFQASLDRKFWAEAINTANYIENRLTTKHHNVTPHKKWFGHKPNMNYFRTFGCKAYVLETGTRKKFDKKRREVIFFGLFRRFERIPIS